MGIWLGPLVQYDISQWHDPPSLKVEDLYLKEFYKLVVMRTEHKDKTIKEWKLLYSQGCGFIQKRVDDNVLNHISDKTIVSSL